ncbi:hypothetical protein DFH07DRAFT_890964 [Mycena maculata]|uniref:Golgi apparatus membrane protein TVP38 n=1 Tax=Mycena maculata TaxID=230809 RepID=A0AAD7IHD6_9AGAR|nr:hypothetical protein DFH07DRAFT_890964 [Mycena maculata]
MDSHRRPQLLALSSQIPARPVSTSPSQHRPSQSPFRYLHFPEMTEKATPLDMFSSSSPSTSRLSTPPPTPSSSQNRTAAYSRPRGLRIANLLKPWLPLIIYALSSLTFVVAIAFFKTPVFTFLDDLSLWLRADAPFGYAVLFTLIFITTFPPIPMYSTLIVLSGYTFGAWTGAVLSYFAALTGALAVFLLSRTLLRTRITRWLDSACTVKRVVRAVERRPSLLFLVRLAPYPYNVMNCLLAASPTLTLRTYTVCTAASLFKVIIHTSIGAGIHSFKAFHTAPAGGDGNGQEQEEGVLAKVYAVAGLLLCVAIFAYLSLIARRAVNDELGAEEAEGSAEESAAFLANPSDDLEAQQLMVQLRSAPLPPRSSLSR